MASFAESILSRKGKTICMLIYNYYPNMTGGAERQCRLQAHELVRTGYRCYILTARTHMSATFKENDKGSEIIRLPVFQPAVDRLLGLKIK